MYADAESITIDGEKRDTGDYADLVFDGLIDNVNLNEIHPSELGVEAAVDLYLNADPGTIGGSRSIAGIYAIHLAELDREEQDDLKSNIADQVAQRGLVWVAEESDCVIETEQEALQLIEDVKTFARVCSDPKLVEQTVQRVKDNLRANLFDLNIDL